MPEKGQFISSGDAVTDAKTLQRGDQVPHFEVKTLAGDVFSYTTIWQRKNLVLVTLPEAVDSSSASALGGLPAEALAEGGRCRDVQQHDGAWVITRDPVPGVPTPGALVADRWGEIVQIAAAPQVSGLPTVSELLEWLDYVERRCPECEGEAK